MSYGEGLKAGEDREYLRVLPRAEIPLGDAAHIKEFYSKHKGDLTIPDSWVVEYIGTRLFIEWCGEMRSKGLPADTNKFDYDVFKKFVNDEMQYEFERPDSLSDKGEDRRGGFYNVRHKVLEALTLNAIEFFKENGGIDGIQGNTRNLRCDLRPYLEMRKHLKKAA